MEPRFEHCDLALDGKIVKGYRVGVKLDDGQVVEREWLHFPGAAVVLPVLDDGSVVLIRNRRFAVGETLYELPAGNIEPDEPPETCAARELTEETGYTAETVVRLGEFYVAPGTSDENLHAYLATGLTGGRQDLEAHERITVETFSDEQVRRMIRDGTIHDAKTIAALTLYWLGEGAI